MSTAGISDGLAIAATLYGLSTVAVIVADRVRQARADSHAARVRASHPHEDVLREIAGHIAVIAEFHQTRTGA